MTIHLPDSLMDWLEAQATANRRSKTKQVQIILEQAKSEDEKTRCLVSSTLMCSNGTHRFESSNPAISDFCNCGMFVYGEAIR